MQNFIVNTLLFASLALALVPKSPIQEPTEIEDLNATIADSSSEHSLNKRNGMLYCGNFASSHGLTASTLSSELQSANKLWSIGAGSCLRTSCRDTSAIYVCNDRSTTLSVRGAEITKHTLPILQQCCIYADNGEKIYAGSIGGQQFTNALGGGWNVVIGYGNCNHAASQKPSSIGGWGINRSCARTSKYIS